MPGLTDLPDALSGLQDRVTTRLQEGAAFANYPPRSETDGETDDQVGKVQAKYKCRVTVALPDIVAGFRHEARRAILTVEFEEAVKVNRATAGFKTARSLAMEAHNLLCAWQPEGGWSPLEFVDLTTLTQKPTFIVQLRVSTQLLLTSG
ncbi:MAG: hypothetical protein FD161_2977 [Limisphaerales bacterium]|nr:MAG: hypothetical protein FD161_2977 [Limisphaerales bacterium]KAG0508090.1 MAG: hypothetical protein E1N63_2684 [Limisphaerales bacterium]TXT53057.1 MAG: hypothetical protein FD140_165 [Limisphaerales bacterium]